MSPYVPVPVDEDEENNPRRMSRGPWAKTENKISAYMDAAAAASSTYNTNAIDGSESDANSDSEGGRAPPPPPPPGPILEL